MAYYQGDIPSFSRRSPTMKTSTSTSSSSRLSSVPSALTIPSSSSNASSTDSYVQQTFRDFASHAKKCERCCDPLMSYLEKTEMCPRGRHLAKLVTTSLFDEANEMYRAKRGAPRRKHGKDDDGWQHLEVDIPKGCESVRSLLQAIDRGLQLPASAATSPMMSSTHSRNSSNGSITSTSSPRVVLGESYEYVAAPTSRHHSDEDRRSRRRDRDEEKHRRHRSHSAGGHHGRSRRHSVSQAVVGVEERDRRPYNAAVVHSTRHLAPGSPRSSHDNVSIDSGYSTAGGCPSPDISRGSQYAMDMERRQQRRSTAGPVGPAIPRSALKKTSSVEHLHPHYSRGHTRTPSSPRAGKHATVGFNIEGHYYAPGYP